MRQMEKNKQKPKLLLHTCCGPCAEYPIKVVSDDYDVTLFYYNPNIHPEKEWYRRLEGAIQLAKLRNLPLLAVAGCDPQSWYQLKDQPELRCTGCYNVRLAKTAEQAKLQEFDYISTTLLISPYQQHDLLRKVGETMAERFGLKFLYVDFRVGFRESQKMAMEDGIYRQKYCGCCCSLMTSDFYQKIIKQHAAYDIPQYLYDPIQNQGFLAFNFPVESELEPKLEVVPDRPVRINLIANLTVGVEA